MFFTREDILKIQQALLQLGVKDSELPSAEPVTYDDTLSIVQDGKNRQIGVKDFFNQISLWKREDFLNITDRYDEHYIMLLEAINLVPILQRKDGLVITFQDTNGDWRIYQFRGNITEFLDEEKWFDLYDYRNYIINSIVPDEEDLTASTPNKNGTSVISLKDRPYNTDNFISKGYKILRKNIQNINGSVKNILTQDMINQPNTIYEIRYDFDLQNKIISIPENCTLLFKGGKIANGMIVSNYTKISNCNLIETLRGIPLNLEGNVTTIYGDIIQRTHNFGVNINTRNDLLYTKFDTSYKTFRHIDFANKLGVYDVLVAIKTNLSNGNNGDYVITLGTSKKYSYIDVLKQLTLYHFNIKALKFHQPETSEGEWIRTDSSEEHKEEILNYIVKWKQFVVNTVKEFSNYCNFDTVSISNETNMWECNTPYCDKLLDLVVELKNLGYKVTISSNSVFYKIYDKIVSNLSVLGYNWYPTISYKGLDTIYTKDIAQVLIEDYIHNLNKSNIINNKKIWITETGSLPYEFGLVNPSAYRNLGKYFSEAPIIMLKALKEACSYIENIEFIFEWWLADRYNMSDEEFEKTYKLLLTF